MKDNYEEQRKKLNNLRSLCEKKREEHVKCSNKLKIYTIISFICTLILFLKAFSYINSNSLKCIAFLVIGIIICIVLSIKTIHVVTLEIELITLQHEIITTYCNYFK